MIRTNRYKFPFSLLILGFLITGFHSKAFAQVEITINLSDLKTDNYYLARYYGDKFQMVDTATISDENTLQFKQDVLLPEGIYLLIDQNKNRLIEFLVSSDQSFELTLSQNENNKLICEGSSSTCLFIEQMNFTNEIYQQLQKFGDSKENLVKRDSLIQILESYQTKLVAENPESFVAKIIMAMKEPVVPDSIASDQKKAFYYYKSNYWNTIDLTDDRFLRSPLLNTKLKQYFEQLVPQQADSIISAVDYIINRSKDNLVVRDYLIWYFTDQYQNPKIMGLDKVFVHLADTYFAKLEIANTTASVKQKILERADQLRRLTLGSPAPDLWLVDTTDSFVSFKSIESPYLVLFFWDHECGVCKQELKALKKLYENPNKRFEVFGIAANADFEAWKDYIKSNSLSWVNVNGMKSMTPDFHDLYDIYGTPVIYVLDPERKIIAKRIKAEQIPLVIDHDEKFRKLNTHY